MPNAGDQPIPNPPIQRHARLFRNGRNQALRIPREFELPGDEVVTHKDGHRLVVEPVKKPNTLAELLASWEPRAICHAPSGRSPRTGRNLPEHDISVRPDVIGMTTL